MEEEIKKAYMDWSEKGVSYLNCMYVYDIMMDVDEALQTCDTILDEIDLGIDYTSREKDIDRLLEGHGTLHRYIDVLNCYVDDKLDQPLKKDFKKNATETISRIHLEDFEVDITLGLTENNYITGGMGYAGTMVEQEKAKLTFADFIGTSDGKADGNGLHMAYTNGSVENFAVVDLVTLGGAIAATKFSEMGLKEGLKAFGKTALIDFAGNTAACGVGALGETFDWPVPVTMMLSLAAGITVSISGNKLLFKNADGIEIGSKTLSDAEVKKIGDVLDEGLDINFVSEDLNNILKNKGVTLEEFNALRLRDVSTLSEEERVMLRKIGEQLTEDERLKLIGKSTWDKIVNSISSEDRKKIQGWKFTPSDELYIKYKEIYDNPKYYNQKTGEIHWPPNDGFKEGSKCKKVIPTDTLFKRYGANNGEFLGNSVDSFESRALAPHSEGAEIHYYQLVEDYEFTTGKAAPWFGSEGGAQQYVVYKPDGSKYTIKELEETGIIEDVTELVNKGEIVIE